MKSAPGMDGFSNVLIKKFWNYLRRPLLKYSQCCYNSGSLTPNFRGANIRLIPQKGGLESIKNWRPISLLSNMHKLISRALNTRLEKVINRICSRSQKGFNKSRYAQEVLINVWESIAHCKTNNINGVVLAVDMAKAFDTLSNSFLSRVLKFFNFGDNFTQWLSLIGNNRTACVLLDNGATTRNFALERGGPQGDNISPITFNICIQILIFKLELDREILSIPRAPRDAPADCQLPDVFCFESNRETDRNEGLADDNTTITILDIECLRRIKNCINDFSAISGLLCNFEKSVLVPINQPAHEELHAFRDLGFVVTDSFKLLGLTIKPSLDNNVDIFEEILNKIRGLILFWERFRLSLPGRLAIMKTYLISKLNYIDSFLPAPADLLTTIQNCINTFVKKKNKNLRGQTLSTG